MVRLKAEGRVDGRVAKGIANHIVQVSGERLLKLEHMVSEQGRALVEKDDVIAEKDAVIASEKKRIADLEKELARYKEYYGKAPPPGHKPQQQPSSIDGPAFRSAHKEPAQAFWQEARRTGRTQRTYNRVV